VKEKKQQHMCELKRGKEGEKETLIYFGSPVWPVLNVNFLV